MKKENFRALVLSIALLLFIQAQAGFEEEMGKGTAAWSYVQTPEDKKHIVFYKQLYEKNHPQTASDVASIPKVAHFIWLGPNQFPLESIQHIKKWSELHPDWTLQFWTDIDREPPVSGMRKKLVSNFSFKQLEQAYYQAENFGEKSHFLRYEVLLQEGGVYIDHDVEALSRFDPLHASYDFYCGLEPLAPSILSSSVFPSTHLIGAKPNHPIIHATIDWLAVHCDRLEKEYPGTDLDAVKNRITHRVVCALDNGIHAGTGHRDIILPSTAFSSSKATKTSFARHLHANSWLERVSDEQRKVLKRLHEMEHTSKIMMLSLIGLGGMNLGAALVMFSKTKKRKQ